MTTIYGTQLEDIANKERLEEAFQLQRDLKDPVFYLLPSHQWLQKARSRQPGLLFTTFDDVANYILKQTAESYIELSEHERTLFFQQFVEEKQEIQHGKIKGYADTYGQIARLGLTIENVPTSVKELVPLFETYEQEVTNRRMLDPEHVILYAIRYLKNNLHVPIGAVIVDGYYDFSPLQFLLLEALKEAGIRVDVYLPNHQQLDIVEETLTDLQKIGYATNFKLLQKERKHQEVELIAATTEEEQWRGVLEDIQLSELAFEEIGILVAGEKNDELLRQANEMGLPLNHSKKKRLSDTAVYTLLLKCIQETGAFETKWERLPLVEQLLSVFFVKGIHYSKVKQLFLQSQELSEPAVNNAYQTIIQTKWSKRATFLVYVKQLLDLVHALKINKELENTFKLETETIKLQQIVLEQRALLQIKEKLKLYEKQLIEKGLTSLEMNRDIFHDWFRELGETTQLFLERGSKRGIQLHTWRDVGLFKGTKLYVVGMNEGVYPRVNQLSGYVQERDLYDSSIRFGSPTLLHFQKKQDAYFEQLFYVASSLSFVYVNGLDPNHPLLPSPFVEDLPINRKWSWEKRMTNDYAFSEKEQVEKLAYHLGKKFIVKNLPSSLRKLTRQSERLETGEEVIEQFRNRQPVVSVTELESYARCPFRYSMERVLNVREPGAQMERVSPLDIGQLVHTLIENVYKELGLVGITFDSLTEEQKEQVPNLITERFETLWENIEKQLHEIPQLDLELSKKEWSRRLQKWWQAERKHFWDNPRLSTMKIDALETAVRWEMTLTNGERLILAGKVDRVDIEEEGFVIYDYKTGAASIKMEEDVRTGLKLQLPLYTHALKKQLEQRENQPMSALGASYISLKEPNKRAGNGIWRSDHVGKGSIFQVSSQCRNREDELGTDSFLEKYQLKERIEELWNGMNHSFPVAPIECSNFCQYRSVCRVTEAQREKGGV
ncbi:PD-(D/E)XK nuclease family protein [Bacillus solitudinis]|uniref:PD-(D/E)XK nuclease family protein n=1 Tax=Bacillus solitudinis TaxID=2014074 RepID=UPI000C234B36|nr:PD-(D/E)XK nuclease family protein [Bacillus solitudinis]